MGVFLSEAGGPPSPEHYIEIDGVETLNPAYEIWLADEKVRQSEQGQREAENPATRGRTAELDRAFAAVYGPNWTTWTNAGKEAMTLIIKGMISQAGISYTDEAGMTDLLRLASTNPEFNLEVTHLRNDIARRRRGARWDAVFKIGKIVLTALGIGGILTPVGYAAGQAAIPSNTPPPFNPADPAGTLTPYQTPPPTLPVSTDPGVNSYYTGQTQNIPGGGTVSSSPTIPLVTGTPVTGTPTSGKFDPATTAKKLLSGEWTWSDILKDFGKAGIDAISEYLGAQQKNRQATARKDESMRDIAATQAYMEKEAKRQTGYVDVDYARQVDDLRRSQYMQDLHKQESLTQRGITPVTNSSIAQSEWRRLAESKKVENEGVDILKKRKMEEIASGLERSQITAERAGREVGREFNEAYTSWQDVIKPKNTSDLWGGVLEEGIKEITK